MVARRKKGHLPVPVLPKWLEPLTVVQGEFLKTKDDRAVFERAVKSLFNKEDEGAACALLTTAKRYRTEGAIKDLRVFARCSPAKVGRLQTGSRCQSFLRPGHQAQRNIEHFGQDGVQSPRWSALFHS